jgi:hypothetical protein
VVIPLDTTTARSDLFAPLGFVTVEAGLLGRMAGDIAITVL